MRRRATSWGTAALTALLVASSLSAPADAAPRRPTPVTITGSNAAFSPNGDGSQDVGTVTYRLTKPSRVTATVSRGGKRVLTVGLGRKAAGTKVFRWNGKRAGKVVADGRYTVTIAARGARARTPLVVDARYGSVDTGRVVASSSTVHPRTTVITDDVRGWFVLRKPITTEDALDGTRWQVLDRAGRVVRTGPVALVDRMASGDPSCGGGCGFWDWDGRDSAGAVVPIGTYRFRVVRTDRAGNPVPQGAPVVVSVSDVPLVERTTTTTTSASQVRFRSTDSRGCEPTDLPTGGLRFPRGAVDRAGLVCTATRTFLGDLPARRSADDTFTVTLRGGPSTSGGTGGGTLSIRDTQSLVTGSDGTVTATSTIPRQAYSVLEDDALNAAFTFQGDDYDLATITYTLTQYVPAP